MRWSFEEFWVVDYSSVLIKRDSSRDHFLNILEMRLSLQKLSVMGSYSGTNLLFLRKKNVLRHCPSNYRGKY